MIESSNTLALRKGSPAHVMIDSASNNDTTVEWLDRCIREEGGIGFNHKERRLFCVGRR